VPFYSPISGGSMNLELMCLTRFGHVRTGLLVLALSSVAGIAALPTSSSLSDAQMSRIVGKDGEPCSQVVPNDECKPYTNACATCQDRLIDAGGEPACPTDDGHIYTIKSGNTFQVCILRMARQGRSAAQSVPSIACVNTSASPMPSQPTPDVPGAHAGH